MIDPVITLTRIVVIALVWLVGAMVVPAYFVAKLVAWAVSTGFDALAAMSSRPAPVHYGKGRVW
jgi:hypothetical protein